MPVVTLTTENSIIKDTSIMNWAPTTNNASSVGIGVGINSNGLQRSFLKFDLGLIPNDAIINNATLNLYTSPTVSGRTIEIHKVTSDWIDTSVTWNSAPGFDSSISTTAITGSTVGTMNFNITGLVQTWVNGVSPNYGMALKDSNETGSNNATVFNSTEASSNKPTIIIDYSIPITGKKQVEYVGSSQFIDNDSQITHNLPIPALAKDGDFLVVQFTVTARGYKLPPGWGVWITGLQDGRDHVIAAKFKTSTDVGNVPISTDTAGRLNGYMHIFRNVKQVDGRWSRLINGSSLYFPTSLATTNKNNTMFVLLNSVTAYATFSPPKNYNEAVDSAMVAPYSSNLQCAFGYMHDKRSQNESELTSQSNYSASYGVAGLLVLEPIINNLPTLTLTSPSNNQTLTEGKTLTISGSATDADSGNVVTVKYKIDNGTTYNITASVSNGTTPINFSKTLTYVNNRLYDGSNPVTPILAENVTHTLTVWAEDDQGGKSPDTTRNFTVLYNQPPQISGSDQDLGTITTPPSIQYTVTDVEGYSFTITDAVDGNTIRSFPGTDGKQETLTIPHDMWIKLQPGVTHQLTITATDQYNASSKRTFTFKRAVDGIELATTAILPADAQPTRVILSLNGTIPDGANLNVQVCNNAHDVSPTWEDMSQSVKNGRPYVFTNTTSTSGQWGIRFKISILPGG
ncbi:DNRLRE domain-containing protein [Brevibacillus sp. M2.1A]|uniref:DNRLRE domain-containing protein n=1 Tax=Brevibacillus sp. M2.1A TaxID=2738980 RepID=UPI00156ACADD|nr:DNRLRE domain-containing protein [Brevibacillus sp. M2.1A]MCC8435492.1 DNRLRE domain-containing protein [Brevibacillus sp. M2.1A]